MYVPQGGQIQTGGPGGYIPPAVSYVPQNGGGGGFYTPQGYDQGKGNKSKCSTNQKRIKNIFHISQVDMGLNTFLVNLARNHCGLAVKVLYFDVVNFERYNKAFSFSFG